MEDNKQQQNPIPVMDIQPARISQNEQPVPVPSPAGPPVPEQPASTTTDTMQSTDGPQGASPVLAAVASGHNSHRTPVLAIVSAIIIAGAFASVAVLVYLSNPGAKQVNNSSQQPATVQEEQSATTGDVTETEKAIDDSLSGVDDAADYDDASMSDTTLGL